jgi:uncharacterized membrane protein HdeD (DUF308 family)
MGGEPRRVAAQSANIGHTNTTIYTPLWVMTLPLLFGYTGNISSINISKSKGENMETTITLQNNIKEILSKAWWLVLLQGIAAVIIGGLLIAQPGLTVLALVQFMGAYWFVDGIFKLIAALTGPTGAISRGWALLSGILGILAGLVVFSQPMAAAMLTPLFLVYLLAFQAILSGVIQMVYVIQVSQVIENEWSIILTGLLSIILGIILLGQPLMSAAVLPVMLGIFALAGGISLIFFAFRVRSVAKIVA